MTFSSQPKRLSWRGRLALVLIGLLFAVGIIEAAGRVLHLMPVAPPAEYYALRAVVGKLPEPYAHFFYRQEARPLDESEFMTWVHFNYHSLRDIDHDYAPPEESPRVMFLGDSFVAAWEVPQNETFVARLRAAVPGVEFISAGFHGWGTDRQFLWYREEGRKYACDLVVLQVYVANDVLDNGIGVFDLPRGEQRPYFLLDASGALQYIDYDDPKPGPYTAEEQGFSGRVRWWLNQYSFTYRLLRDGLKTLGEVLSGTYGAPIVQPPQDSPPPAAGDAADPPADTMELFREQFGPAYDSRWQDAWTITRELVRALRAEVEAHGGQFAVMLVPPREEEMPQLWADVVARFDLDDSWDPGKPTRLWREFLQAEGIPYLDMLPPSRAYSEATGGQMRFAIDPHWTAEGHCVAAAAVEDWLLAGGLLGEAGSAQPLNALDCAAAK